MRKWSRLSLLFQMFLPSIASFRLLAGDVGEGIFEGVEIPEPIVIDEYLSQPRRENSYVLLKARDKGDCDGLLSLLNVPGEKSYFYSRHMTEWMFGWGGRDDWEWVSAFPFRAGYKYDVIEKRKVSINQYGDFIYAYRSPVCRNDYKCDADIHLVNREVELLDSVKTRGKLDTTRFFPELLRNDGDAKYKIITGSPNVELELSKIGFPVNSIYSDIVEVGGRDLLIQAYTRQNPNYQVDNAQAVVLVYENWRDLDAPICVFSGRYAGGKWH